MPDQLTVNQYESGQGEGLQLCDYSDLLIWGTFSDSDEAWYDKRTLMEKNTVMAIMQYWRWSPPQKPETEPKTTSVTFRCRNSATTVVDYHKVAPEAFQRLLWLNAFGIWAFILV